jgi:ABC-type bacteriocin/lantibiotic exporter with double-glycine peptidase domain
MFFRSALFIILTIVILSFVSWKLTLVAVGGILPVVGLLKINGAFTKKYTKEIQTKKALLGSVSEEAISCIKTVKAFSTEHVEMERYNKANDAAFDLGMKVAWINGFFDTFVKASL